MKFILDEPLSGLSEIRIKLHDKFVYIVMRGSEDLCVIRTHKPEAPNDGFLLNTLKTLLRLSTVLFAFEVRERNPNLCWVFCALLGLLCN